MTVTEAVKFGGDVCNAETGHLNRGGDPGQTGMLAGLSGMVLSPRTADRGVSPRGSYSNGNLLEHSDKSLCQGCF